MPAKMSNFAINRCTGIEVSAVVIIRQNENCIQLVILYILKGTLGSRVISELVSDFRIFYIHNFSGESILPT
jgi:hypothetical protein